MVRVQGVTTLAMYPIKMLEYWCPVFRRKWYLKSVFTYENGFVYICFVIICQMTLDILMMFLGCCNGLGWDVPLIIMFLFLCKSINVGVVVPLPLVFSLVPRCFVVHENTMIWISL